MVGGANYQRAVALSVAIAVATLCGPMVRPAIAEQPVAIVEDVRSATAQVQVFEYLRLGQVIHLGKTGLLILGYLRSCLRETITGGHVIIGKMESVVKEGLVDREVVECDGGRSNLSPAEASKSGVIVFRAPDAATSGARVKPVHIYSASPIFTFRDSVDEVVIRRLDVAGEAIVLRVHGKTLDLAELGKRLAPGARYEAYAGGKAQIFEVDLHASAKGEPLIGRLIRF